jgi:hypothetical protein
MQIAMSFDGRWYGSPDLTFDAACSRVEALLTGSTRREVVADLARSNRFSEALIKLRDGMRTHLWKTGAHQISLARIVKAYDSRTREEGFHALHDWDGKADIVNENTIPIDVLNYLVERRGAEEPNAQSLAILLDYYLVYVLALLSLRVWDEGDPNHNLDRVTRLLADLQGTDGSGQKFATNAETLMLIATSHYEPDERGYETLLASTRTLDRAHRTSVALVHAASMGCHLRFGFEATYARDTVLMRKDNVADYPWVCFAVATLMEEYSRLRDEGVQGAEREAAVEAILNALSFDARAFIGEPPASLSASVAERTDFCERFHRCRNDLLGEFERHRPTEHAYSPLSLFFNFSHNVVKGMVVDAVLCGRPWDLTLNDLLTAMPQDGPTARAKARLAKTLMEYARASPDRIRGRLMPVIVYDPRSGRQAFSVMMRKLTELAGRSNAQLPNSQGRVS